MRNDYDMDVMMDKFKQSKDKGSERIVVTLTKGVVPRKHENWTAHLYSTKQIPEDRFPELNAAIEKVLNGELDNPAPIPQEANYVGSISKDKFWLSTSREYDIKEVEVNNKKFVPEKSPETPTNTVTDNSDVACLSLNDLHEVWATDELNKGGYFRDSPLYKNFEQKVKEKLKQ